MKIRVYSTSTCSYCHAVMDWLEENHIAYEEVDATQFPEITTVPVTKIGDETVVGFDRPALKKALQKHGLI